MKKYFIILIIFFIIDVLLATILGAQSDQLKYVQWYLILIFMEAPIYGTLILYEVRKRENDKK